VRSPQPGTLDDREWLTVVDFARLPADARHAVWKAADEGRIDWVPVTASQPNGMRCYHRDQVTELLAGLAVSRG